MGEKMPGQDRQKEEWREMGGKGSYWGDREGTWGTGGGREGVQWN